MRSRDTTDEAHAVQVEAWRRMGPARRVLLAFEMSERAREIAIAGILAREPELGPDGARARMLRQILGDDLYEAAYAGRGAALGRRPSVDETTGRSQMEPKDVDP